MVHTESEVGEGLIPDYMVSLVVYFLIVSSKLYLVNLLDKKLLSNA